MNSKQKKILKVLSLVFLMVVLTGCTSNLEKDGTLKAARAITVDTPWTLSVGIFDFIFVFPIAKFILFMEQYIGVVASVVLATVIVNLITLPLMIKSQISSQKMQMLAPKQEAIQRKYKGRNDQASQMRMSAELQALYKKNGVSMGASFAPFLSFPIMIAMWQAVQRIQIIYTTNFCGLNLGDTPMAHVKEWPYIVLVVIVGITQFLSIESNTYFMKKQKGYRPNAAMDQMRYMNIFMIFMIVYMSFVMASAMSIYWITTSVISIIRTVYIYYGHTAKIQDDQPKSYLDKKSKKK